MAERRNYYEIIDRLSFDPIEMKDKRIIDAIELWKFSEEHRGISNEEEGGEQRQQELDMYENIKACLTDRASRKREADAMKQKQKKKLDGIIAVLKESGDGGSLYVSNARILAIAKSLRLDKEKTVKKAFTDAGYEVIIRKPVNITNDILLSNTVFNGVAANVKKLSAMNSKDFPWLGKVGNLYDLAAFFNNDGTNAGIYASRPAAELKSIMEAGAASVAGKLDGLNHCFADLFQAGSTQIFKDEKTKTKYDNSLKVEELYGLFSLLKEMPEEMKKDAYIADICIKKIQSYFPDPDVALAIYNREAGNGQDPYEPDSGDVDFLCGSCRATTKIKYGTDKERCKCAACGAPMFVKCRSCSSLIPAVADICPECRFNLVESKFFDRYSALARSAIESMDIAEARKQFALARGARPNDPKLKILEAEVNEAIQLYEAPLQAIKDLMNQGKYMQASGQLAAFCSKYPGVKVDDVKTKIDKTIADADRVFSQMEKQADPCGVCFDILDRIKDYAKASDYIKNRKPKAVSNVRATVSTKSNQVTLQWLGTGEREVTYCVVRKENSKPQSMNDGSIVLNNQLVTQFVDSSISAGVVYYYAVFAQRIGTYSIPAASAACILFRELDEERVIRNAEDGKCVLSWQLPENCKGVRVLRSDNGKADTAPGQSTKLIAECAPNGYEDRAVINETRYEYRLQCVYNVENGVRYSEGITFSIMPDSRPKSVTLVSVNVKSENAVQITWNCKHDIRNCIMDLYDVKPGINVVEGTTYRVAELTKIGAKIGTVSDVSAKSFEMRVSQKKGYRLCALVVKGEYAVISNCIYFSNYDKVEIDRANTKITGGNLVIFLKGNFQQSLTYIRYAVATKNNDQEQAPWCKIEDAPGMTQLSVKAYLSDGMIKIGKVPEKELYISVIGEYVIGKDVYYSEPSRLRKSNRPKAEISYKIVWGLLSKRRNVRLIIECNTDTELPEMFLCCNKTIKVPMSANAPNNIMLCKIQENMDYKAHTKLEIEIPNAVWNTVTKGNEIRLFLPEDSYTEFRMMPEIGSLKIP